MALDLGNTTPPLRHHIIFLLPRLQRDARGGTVLCTQTGREVVAFSGRWRLLRR